MTGSPDDPLESIVCPSCGALIRPRARHAGRRVRCPQCKSVVAVSEVTSQEPTTSDEPLGAPLWPDDQPRPAAHHRAEAFEIEAPPVHVPPPLPEAYHRAKANLEARLAAAPKPPRLMFVAGVFTFPFQADVALRWGCLTGSLIGCGLLAWPALAHPGIVMVLFGVSLLIALIWVVTYAASSMLAIVEQTSAGNDEVSWPDLGLFDRLIPAASVGWLAGLAITIGWLAGLPLQSVAGPAGHATTASLVALIVFPILLLSAMDRGTPLLPWSSDVLASLRSDGRSWAVFYLLGGLVLLASWGAPLALVSAAPVTSIFLAPPLIAAGLLIYSRLLGRLGWTINLKR